jgi:uncharacterized membrane protein
MKWFLIGVAALHAVFTLCELFPWSFPFLLRILSKKLPTGQGWAASQQVLVATIVHNAGIYNAILAGGLLWTAYSGDSAQDVGIVLLAGAAVAGVFGTVTLKSPVTALQAFLGIVGVALYAFFPNI